MSPSAHHPHDDGFLQNAQARHSPFDLDAARVFGMLNRIAAHQLRAAVCITPHSAHSPIKMPAGTHQLPNPGRQSAMTPHQYSLATATRYRRRLLHSGYRAFSENSADIRFRLVPRPAAPTAPHVSHRRRGDSCGWAFGIVEAARESLPRQRLTRCPGQEQQHVINRSATAMISSSRIVAALIRVPRGSSAAIPRPGVRQALPARGLPPAGNQRAGGSQRAVVCVTEQERSALARERGRRRRSDCCLPLGKLHRENGHGATRGFTDSR